MKNLLFSLALFSITLPTLGQEMDKVDSVIFQCMGKHYSQHNIDLNDALDSIEYELIQQEAIASADSIGIKSYYEGVANGEEVPQISYSPLMDSITSNYHFQGNLRACIFDHPEVDTIRFENSNYMNRQVELRNKVNELGGANPTNAAKAMLAVYSFEDFSTELFRANFLLSVLVIAYKDKSYLKSSK